MQATWRTAAFDTDFNFELEGKLEISSVEYTAFKFTFATLKTVNNQVTFAWQPQSPESSATTIIIMSYVLTRPMLKDTYLIVRLPAKNLYAKDDAGYSPVFTHITQSKYSFTLTDQ